MYGHALQHYGRDYVLRHVGVEPTGEAFNSIVLDEVANRPFNPMVNAGAIAVAALMPGNTPEERIATMLDLFSDLAGRKLEIDQSVFQSEHATGHRNRAIAYMMLNTGMIERDPMEALDLYFWQCAKPPAMPWSTESACARKLILRLAHSMRKSDTKLMFAEIGADGPLVGISRELSEHEADRLLRVFRDVDVALEWCEDQLLAEMLQRDSEQPKFSLSKLDMFQGLNAEECHLLETIVRPLLFNKGEVIIREGDQAKLFFVLAWGSVSIQIRVPTQTGEKRRRVASLGPGLTFGEMSLFGGGARSADVVANEKVICYGLAVEELKELAGAHPNIMVTILSNLTRDFSERLRHANQAIRSLE
jgi:CRP-like cAMP-binding protein